MALRAILALLLAATLSAGCASDLSGGGTSPPEGLPPADDPGSQRSRSEDQSADDAAPTQSSPEGDGGAAGDSTAPRPPADDPLRADRPVGARAGTAATHGAAQRTDGPVSVEPDGNQYIAKRTVTLANDFGGAVRSDLVLSTFNGDVALQPSQDGGYLLVAELHGSGATEDEARKALELLELQATDGLQGDRIGLSFTLVSGSPTPLPVPVVMVDTVNNGGSFRLWVPPQPAHGVGMNSTNGDMAVSGLHGPRYLAGTVNGDIAADGSWDQVEARSTNGAITVGGGTINDVTAENTNGDLAITAAPSRTSAIRLTSSNGDIDVAVPRDPAVAFDVEGDTTNGEVTIAVEEHDSESEGHGAYRSPGWASARVQLTLDLQSTNGSIVVED